jgi:hypothetical protein
MRRVFAGGVILAVAAGAAIGLAVPVPEELPGLAQGSVALWRAQQAAFFSGLFYLFVTAIVSAMEGRGFTEIGPGGVKTGQVVQKQQQAALERQNETINAIRREAEKDAALLQVAMLQTQQKLKELEQRQVKLEDKL